MPSPSAAAAENRPASPGSGPNPGDGCPAARRATPPSARCGDLGTPRRPHPGTCSSTSAPSAWTCASSRSRGSGRGSARRSPSRTKRRASGTSTGATCSAPLDTTGNPAGRKAREAVTIGDDDPVRRRQLRDRAEIRARHRRVERTAGRVTGTDRGPRQTGSPVGAVVRSDGLGSGLLRSLRRLGLRRDGLVGGVLGLDVPDGGHGFGAVPQESVELLLVQDGDP